MNTVSDYQKTAHKSVDHLFRNIDLLKQKGRFIKQEQQQMFQQKVSELDEKKEQLREKYNALSSATGDASQDLKKGFEEAKGALTTAWNEAKAEFVS